MTTTKNISVSIVCIAASVTRFWKTIWEDVSYTEHKESRFQKLMTRRSVTESSLQKPNTNYLYLLSSTGPIVDIGGMGAFFEGTFLEERAFCLLTPPKQIPFLTSSNENIFFKFQGTRLGAIVTPNKDLEWALIYADFGGILRKQDYSCEPSSSKSFTTQYQHHVPCGSYI